jgi:hypothetical protein
LSWVDGIIAFSSLFQSLTEATANFAHLYGNGTAKCKFLSNLLGRVFKNFGAFGCPSRKSFRMTTGRSLPCHKLPDKSCSASNALSLYGWLKHRNQHKYVKYTKDNSCHTIFNSGVEL